MPIEVIGGIDYALSTKFHPSAVTLESAADRFLDPLRNCAQTLEETLTSIRPG